ncbi:pyruvate kinase [Cokeromyces recurvatus]|uniref:pyruvate kinase n=1 Tax=Cokeromyces recurvatus TaxID=90255 RepID=UPI002220D85C|nr:pyruvate kinase [Cokeromyces recurvatus]KAI7899861.1 pyruvate kinase [Cokeromyces recurvatus]
MAPLTPEITSNIQWISQMSVDVESTAGRKTSIIGTIGPKTNSVEMITQLRNSGLNVVRMNFSHGTHEYHKSVIENTRKSVELYPGRPVAIALDNKGPEIRTGIMKDDIEISIDPGHEMIFSVDEQYADQCTDEILYIDYKNLPTVIEVGKTVYIDDGVLSFEVTEILEDGIRVVSRNGGKLCSHKGVNLPNTDVDLPALSEKDIADLRFGVEQKVDIIFASFVRRGQDVKEIREVLGEDGKNIKIISKIESYQGVENFDDILQETDGIMVARGDMGIEIPLERVFIAQKMMITKCNLAGKPVICATQMLESMTYNPRPTRAEVSDVANAVLDGADCVMLSGETAKGNYPIEAVKTMHEICQLAESVVCYPAVFNELRSLTALPTETTETVACAAVAAAHEQNAGCIIVLTTSGKSARLIAKYRPHSPIIVVTRNPQTARQIHFHRGCFPFYYPKASSSASLHLSAAHSPSHLRTPENAPWQEDVDSRIKWGNYTVVFFFFLTDEHRLNQTTLFIYLFFIGMEQAMKYGLLKHGQPVVAVQGWKGGLGNTNTLRIIYSPNESSD